MKGFYAYPCNFNTGFAKLMLLGGVMLRANRATGWTALPPNLREATTC